MPTNQNDPAKNSTTPETCVSGVVDLLKSCDILSTPARVLLIRFIYSLINTLNYLRSRLLSFLTCFCKNSELLIKLKLKMLTIFKKFIIFQTV